MGPRKLKTCFHGLVDSQTRMYPSLPGAFDWVDGAWTPRGLCPYVEHIWVSEKWENDSIIKQNRANITRIGQSKKTEPWLGIGRTWRQTTGTVAAKKLLSPSDRTVARRQKLFTGDKPCFLDASSYMPWQVSVFFEFSRFRIIFSILVMKDISQISYV